MADSISATGIAIQMPFRPHNRGKMMINGTRKINCRLRLWMIDLAAYPKLWKKLDPTICIPTSGKAATVIRIPFSVIESSSGSEVKTEAKK